MDSLGRRQLARATFLLVAATPLVLPRTARSVPSCAAILLLLACDAGEQERVLRGEIITSTAHETSERDLALTIAFAIQHPPADVLDLFRNAIGYEMDPSYTAFGRVSGPGTLDDFAGVRLTAAGGDEAHRDLAAAGGGQLNLGATEQSRFDDLRRQDATSREEVEEQLRLLLLARYRAYRTEGLDGLAPYVRQRGSERDGGMELRAFTEAARVLETQAPDFYGTLLHYPVVKPADLQEWFFWLRRTIDGRPTFILSHWMSLPFGDGFLIAERHYYASGSYNVMQAISALLPIDRSQSHGRAGL